MPPPSLPLIELNHIGKDYPKVSTAGSRIRTLAQLLLRQAPTSYYRALVDINLHVNRGESVGVIGENGAGKSTLLKIIAGVIKPSSGEIQIRGRIGALLELGTGFHPEYTGRENIFLAAALMGWSRRDVIDRVDSIIAFADIGDHIDEPIKHYSTGMTVRLGFAVATALEPDVLITDEVLAVGDESFQKKCIRWMEDFMHKQGTLLLCSHSMYHIQTLCPKSIWIHEGALRMAGDSYSVTQAYLAYHKEKNRETAPLPVMLASHEHPTMRDHWIENSRGNRVSSIAMGEDVAFCGLFNSPMDEPTIALIGITSMDATPIFGTLSSDGNFVPNRIAPTIFGFRMNLPTLNMLPGKYRFRAHVLDQSGLRLHDTLDMDFIVTGKSRDYGVFQPVHEWCEGKLPPASDQ